LPDLLVIDDLPELCDLLSAALAEQGFRVTSAGNAIEARRLLAERPFDLLLIDAVLPGESGESLAAFAETLGLPVILMSGHFRLLEADHARWPILVKPFRIDEVIALVREVLGRTSN
jgi:DNA-binding response OmpR family regulator